jgi:4-amino-4-deoxy-L-arabinose transferase-like glycosyltransferase
MRGVGMEQGRAARLLSLFRTGPMISAGLIAILALTFYLRLLYFGQYIDADVGNAGYMAWRMAEGEILLDLEGPGKPPLYSMLYAVFIRLFGTSILGLKIFGVLFVLLAVLAVYWLANQGYGKRVGLLAALLFGVFSSGPMVEGGTLNLETVLHLPYVLAIGLFLKASVSGRLRWYFLAGLCAGLATLVKQVGGVLFFVCLCYGIYERWRKDDPLPPKQWLSRYVLLGGGALLPMMGVIIFYHFHGYTLNQLYDSLLGSNLRYIQRGHEVGSLLKSFSFSLKNILPENSLLWAGTIFAAACLGLRIWHGKAKASDGILLLWGFWSFAVLWATGTFFQHYFLQIVAPFSVLAAYGMVASWKWAKSLPPLSRFVAQGGWTILLVIMVIFFMKTDYRYFFVYTPEEQTVFQYKFLSGVFDGRGLYNVVQHQIAYYLRAHTNPTDAIYVWGIAPQIYFLAQRKAATRYRNNYNMSALVTPEPVKELQAYAPAVMEDLIKSHPAYIVQIFRLEDFPALQSLVQEQYTADMYAELSIPPYRICLYRRRPDLPSLPSLR